jgi:hypothetical protein
MGRGRWPGRLIQKGQQDSWICISFSIYKKYHSILITSLLVQTGIAAAIHRLCN